MRNCKQDKAAKGPTTKYAGIVALPVLKPEQMEGGMTMVQASKTPPQGRGLKLLCAHSL
jgi:hypothetical protein